MISAKTNQKRELQKLILPSYSNKKLQLLYGILLGDGCLSQVGNKYHFISITGHAIDDRIFFKNVLTLLKEITGRDYPIKKRRGNTIELNQQWAKSPHVAWG